MYLVYCTRRDNRADVMIGGIVANDERANEILVSGKRQQKEAFIQNGTTDAIEIGTFLIRTRNAEKDAMDIASRLAACMPMEDVYVAKIVSVVQAKNPDVVVKSVSEKGVLPT